MGTNNLNISTDNRPKLEWNHFSSLRVQLGLYQQRIHREVLALVTIMELDI